MQNCHYLIFLGFVWPCLGISTIWGLDLLCLPGSQQSLTQWPFLPQFWHVPLMLPARLLLDFFCFLDPLSAVPPELACRDLNSKIHAIRVSDVSIGKPALTTVMNVDHDFGNDVNSVFEKSRSEISSPIMCNVCCRLCNFLICSSMFSPSWANIRKNSCRVLI